MKIKKFTQIYFALGLLLSSHGLQAQELYQIRKLPKTVENLSNYNYMIYTSGPEGVFYYDRPIIDTKTTPAIGVSKLGTEAFFIDDKKIYKYNTIDFEVIAKENLKLKSISFKQMTSNEDGTKYFLLSQDNHLYELVANTKNAYVRPLENKWSFSEMYWHENLHHLLVFKDQELWFFNPYTQEKLASKIFSKPISSVNAHESEFLITVGFTDGSFQLWTQDLREQLIEAQISQAALGVIAEDPIDHYYYFGDHQGKIHTFDYLRKEVITSEKYFSSKIDMKSVYDPIKKKKYLMSIGSGASKLNILDITGLTPNYQRIIKERLTQLKEAFLSIKNGESPEAYDQRVNEKSIKEFTENKTTFLQDSIAYTLATAKEEIQIDGDSIRVCVAPFSPVAIKLFESVANTSDLKIKDIHYLLKENNDFAIQSLSIVGNDIKPIKYSSDTGTMLAYEKEISLALAKEVARKEAEFKNSLSEAVAQLKSVGKLNDVELSVNSALKQGKDTNGNDETNLHILFVSQGMETDKASEGSDYPSGKYLISDSEAAQTLVNFFIKSAEGNLSEYLIGGRKVSLNITGATDKSGISKALPYNNEFGAFTNFPYYFQSQLSGLNISQESGIKNNSELGFLRTFSVREYIKEKTTAFENNPTEFNHFSEQAEGYGASFRKIKIELIIHKVDQVPSN